MAQIVLNIPDNKVAQYRDWFIAYNPVPIVNGSPVMSEIAWIKQCLKEYLLNQCRGGEHKLAIEALAATGVSEGDVT